MDPEEQAEDTGQLEEGNIDLHSRPILHNPDGSISTVRSMSVGLPEGEVLIPTVGPNGEDLTEDQAIEHYRQTGQHLGIFRTPEAATTYAQALHTQQAQEYLPQAGRAFEGTTAPAITPSEPVHRTRSPEHGEAHHDDTRDHSVYRLLQDGHPVDVSPAEAERGLASGTLQTGQPLRLRHSSSGRIYEIPAEEVASALASRRFVLDTPEDQETRTLRRSLQTAPLRGVTAAASALRGVDFGTGLSESLIERPLGIHEDIEALREANPDIATLGEVGGALLTALPSGGESLLGRAALAPGRAIIGAGERAGALATRALTRPGAGALGRVGARIIGGAVEGGTQAGLSESAHILSEQAFGEDPGDVGDRLIGAVGLGGIIGGGAHGLGATLQEAAQGTARAGRATVEMLSRQFQQQTGQALEPGLASLAEAGIRRGIPLSQVLSGDSENVVPRLLGDGGREARQVLLGGQQLRDQYARELSTAVSEAAQARHVLDQSLHGPAKENALEAIVDVTHLPQQQELAERLMGDVRRISDQIDQSARTYGPTGEYGPRAGLVAERLRQGVSRAEDELQTALQASEPQVRAAEIFSSLDRLRRNVGNLNARSRSAALEGAFSNLRETLQNEGLWGRAASLQSETNEALSREINWSGDFERLFMRPGEQDGFDRVLMADSRRVANHLNGAGNAANDTAERIAREYMQASSDLANAVVRNRAGVIPQAALDAAEHLRGANRRLQELYDRASSAVRLQNQAAALEARGGLSALNAGGLGNAIGGPLFGVAAAGASMLANPVRMARMLGTIERLTTEQNSEISTAIRSFLGKARDTGRSAVRGVRRTAEVVDNASYRGAQAYARRIRELDRHRDPQALTQDIAEGTNFLTDAAPQTAAAVQQTAARATQYLISQQPRGLVLQGTLLPGTRLPPREQMERFLRVARTVDHPKTVLADLKNRTLTPESVQALRTVYPRLYQRIVATVGEELSQEHAKEPDYQDRLQLGILFGVPTDPSLNPQSINILQQFHAVMNNVPAQDQGGSQEASPGAARPRPSTDTSQYLLTQTDSVEFRRSR